MAKRSSKSREFFNCPNCGAEVAEGAKFCRECGASNDSGWGDNETVDEGVAGYDSEDDFDYDDFVRREFPDQAARQDMVSGKAVVFGLVILFVIVALIITAMYSPHH